MNPLETDPNSEPDSLTTNLLHNSQIDSRLKKSAIDAALLLKNEIEVNKANKLKTTTLFLDIKGAFDHVSRNRLICILVMLELPLSLILWVASFLDKRIMRLGFENHLELFRTIIAGIPQGSCISPILFLIYIRDLFQSNSIQHISYMDDLTLTASSTSFQKNIKILEREVKVLFNLGNQNSVEFDVDKLDLIHFYCGTKKPLLSLKMPNGKTLKASRIVKWLGIHFDSNLNFKHHIAIRISQAKQAFYRINRLSNISRGLSPFAIRRLYTACVTSVSDYGSILWWSRHNKSQIKPFELLQNLAMRKILGVFKTAPITAMELEAALPPPNIRLNHHNRRYAFRILKLSSNHPVNKEFKKSISLIDEEAELEDALYSDESVNSELIEIRNRKPTQIINLINSIYHLIDFNQLELIKHFYFPPWGREMPFDVVISTNSKSEESKEHIKYLQNNINNPLLTSIYTDGSQTPEGSGIGLSLAIYEHDSQLIPVNPTFSNYWNIGERVIVYNGELEAIAKAVEHASYRAEFGQTFNIFSDNQAALLRVKTPSDNPGQSQQIRIIEASKLANSHGASINLIWVPGHQDIPGNEEADKLAKLATFSEDLTSEKISFAYLGIQINKLKKQEWAFVLENQKRSKSLNSYSKVYSSRISKRINLPIGTIRELASSLFQLKIGHGYIKSYLYNLQLIRNDRCKCGYKETPIHLLLECNDYESERNSLIERLKKKLKFSKLNLPFILHTQIGISEVLVFLKETRIATRSWYTERAAEEIENSEDEGDWD